MIFLFYFVIVLPSLLSSIQFYPFSFYSFWFYSSSFETLFCCFFLSAPLHLLFYCYLAFISPSLSYVFHFCLFVSICIYPFLPCYNSVSLTFSFPIRFLSSTRIFFIILSFFPHISNHISNIPLPPRHTPLGANQHPRFLCCYEWGEAKGRICKTFVWLRDIHVSWTLMKATLHDNHPINITSTTRAS